MATMAVMLMLLSALSVRLFGLSELMSELIVMSPAPTE